MWLWCMVSERMPLELWMHKCQMCQGVMGRSCCYLGQDRRVKVRECKLLNPQLFPASTWRGGSSSFLEPGLALDWPSLGVKQPRAVTVIPSITWPLLTTGNQQPSLQSHIEGWQWRKVAAAMLPTPALHSHSCTSCGAALSAGFMHTQCYDFLKDVFLLNGLNWESADL